MKTASPVLGKAKQVTIQTQIYHSIRRGKDPGYLVTGLLSVCILYWPSPILSYMFLPVSRHGIQSMPRVSIQRLRLFNVELIIRLSFVAPLNDVSEYESHVFEAIPLRFVNGSLNPAKPTDYGGDRRPALDEAWSKLLQSKLGLHDPLRRMIIHIY